MNSLCHGTLASASASALALALALESVALLTSLAYGTMFCPSVVCLSVTFCIVAKRYVVEGRRWYRWMDKALVSSSRLSIVTMSLTAAVWPQFATQVFRGSIGRLTCIGS